MRVLATAATAAAAVLSATGFGTINGLGQNAEHERITRLALACAPGRSPCLQGRTLDELAGAAGSFGAVGAPDRGTLLLQARAHCDGGDHLDLPGYPQPAADARAALEACRAWMAENLDAAVNHAEGLLDDDGAIRPRQVGLGCVFVGGFPGRAKCEVLEDMGLVLHAAQDFYSHSNWVDRPGAPASPPGLGQDSPAPWLDLRSDPPFPQGLISGCFGGLPESAFCQDRVRHADLNKDNGPIDPASGQVGPGTTPRGAVEGNFERAVRAAAADSAGKWALLGERLVARYGPERGARMACALAMDDPVRDCA